MGTPQYLSPEQARGGTATPASDVYSLGVVAFECLAGHRPFDADSPVATALAHLNDPVPDLPPDVPADLAAVVRRAMSKDAGQRYADGDAFAAALRDPRTAAAAIAPVADGDVPPSERTQVLNVPTQPAPMPAPTPVTDPSPTDDDRRSTWPIVLLVLALVAAIVLIVVVATQANNGDDDDPNPSDSPSSEPTSSAPTSESSATEETSAAPAEVEINEGDYLGRNVDDVAAELKAKGLKVDTQPIDNPGGEEADTVAAVRPTAGLVEGDTVTVEYYREAEPTSEPPTTEPTSEVTSEPPSSDPATPSGSTTPSSSASEAQGSQTPSTSAPAASAPGSRGH
jgi:serine/threonine-protein kinase